MNARQFILSGGNLAARTVAPIDGTPTMTKASIPIHEGVRKAAMTHRIHRFFPESSSVWWPRRYGRKLGTAPSVTWAFLRASFCALVSGCHVVSSLPCHSGDGFSNHCLLNHLPRLPIEPHKPILSFPEPWRQQA